MSNRLNWQAITSSANIVKYNIYRSIVGVESANDEPFSLSGLVLNVSIDAGSDQLFSFTAQTTSQQVIDLINTTLAGGVAHVGASGSVFIRSNNVGGSVRITGGTANAAFGFSTTLYSEKSSFLKIAEVAAAPGVLEYIDEDGYVYDWYKISAVDSLGVESALTIEKQAGPARDPICIVYGTLQDGVGNRLNDQEIVATVEYPPTVNGVTTSWVSRTPVKTLSLRDGTFELELLQNASYRIEIKSIEFSRIMTIPDSATANLFSMHFEEKDQNKGGNTFSY